MGKVLGILLAAVSVWVMVEVYTEGVSGAFGGAFASLSGDGSEARVEHPASTAQRAGAAVERAHQEHEARYEELLPE